MICASCKMNAETIGHLPGCAVMENEIDRLDKLAVELGLHQGIRRPLGAIPAVEIDDASSTAPIPVEDTQKREPGCQCHLEVGDSPCRVHGDDEGRDDVEDTTPDERTCSYDEWAARTP